MNRRDFLRWMAGGLIGGAAGRTLAEQWYIDTPLVAQMRADVDTLLAGRQMTLDFRGINAEQDEVFRIQVRADGLMPVASCFKAFLVLYYYLNTPADEWVDDIFSTVYRTAVYSDNRATGVVLAEVAGRVDGPKNAIEKFNDFLRITVGMQNGLHTWNWEGSPTVGLSDPRYAPSAVNGRVVQLGGQAYQVDNVTTAADLARGHDFITRGEYFTQDADFREAVRRTQALLAIPGDDIGYRSPIERAYDGSYSGKDGILPADMVATGRVVNDAGVIETDSHRYIVAFLSAGESESTALYVLGEVLRQISVYEEGLAQGAG